MPDMKLPAWARVGYQVVEEQAKRIEEAQKSRLSRFVLPPDQEATIRFLTVEPVTFYEHFLPKKAGRQTYTCLRTSQEHPLEACPFCSAGNRPHFRGAYVVLDLRREEWKDRQTGETRTRQYTPKVMKHGVRTLQVLAKLHTKKNLAKWDWEVMRTGSGTDTSYTFTPTNVQEVPKDVLQMVQSVNWLERLVQHLEPPSKEDALAILSGKAPTSFNGQGVPELDQIEENDDIIDL